MRTASWVILRYRADVSFEAGSVPSSLLDSTAGPGSLVVIRFRGTDLPTDQGLAALREAVSILAQCPGFLSGVIGQ